MQLLSIETVDELRKAYDGWIQEALRKDRHLRESKWTQSVAVGSKEYIEKIKAKLGFQVKGRSRSRRGENYQLREQQSAYNTHFTHENVSLSNDNTYMWKISSAI